MQQSGGWGERLRRRWKEGIHHKVTSLGAMMLALLFASGMLALMTTQNVFFLLFSLLLGSSLISSFVNRLMLAGLVVKLEAPEHVVAGEEAACRVIVENKKRWLASFALELLVPVGKRFYFPCVEASGKSEVGLEVVWLRRGVPEAMVVELSTRFPFGFSVRRTRLTVRVSEAVYPSIREQPGFAAVLRELEAKIPGVAGVLDPEFHQLRSYAEGDDWRRIAWGKSARSGELFVKQMQSAGEGRLRVWLDLGSPRFEQLVEMTAYVVWELQYKNAKFVFGSEGMEMEVQSRADAYNILRFLATVEASGAEVPAHDSNTHILSFRAGAVPGTRKDSSGTN